MVSQTWGFSNVSLQVDRPGRRSAICAAVNRNARQGGRSCLSVKEEYVVLRPVIVNVELLSHCYDLMP